MKKLKLSELNLGDAEILTRGQLKKILGGGGSDVGSGGGICTFQLNCMIGSGFQSGGTCTGESDPVYGCAPVEEACYEKASDWCDQQPGCSGCVPY